MAPSGGAAATQALAAGSPPATVAGDPTYDQGGLGKLVAAEAGRTRTLAHKPTPLMVGGSDGSGTRSVVALLEKLGVNMVVDDRGTNDVHADEMGGWPPVVSPVRRAGGRAKRTSPPPPPTLPPTHPATAVAHSPPTGGCLAVYRLYSSPHTPHHTPAASLSQVLQAVHGADYEVDSVERSVVDRTFTSLRALTTSLARKASRYSNSKALGVTYGFKAPVSMCLVPFFHRAYATNAGGMKFLQVVRDGRDIAFSGNQSPVTKFYKANFDAREYVGGGWGRGGDWHSPAKRSTAATHHHLMRPAAC